MSEDLQESATARFRQFLQRFIAIYARVEMDIRRALLNLSGLDQARFRVLVGFLPTSKAVKMLRDIMPIAECDGAAIARVNDALTQLNQISTIRDFIVHYGALPGPPGKIVINRKPDDFDMAVNVEQTMLSFDELDQIISDLESIDITLDHYLCNKSLPYPPAVAKSAESDAPWRYKYHVRQAGKNRRNS